MANAYDQGFLRDPTGALVVTGISGGSGTDPAEGTDTGSLPTQTLWVAGKDGTVLRGIQVDSGGRQVTRLGDGTNTAEILATTPASDTGQAALAVRVISQLGAGTGGGGGGAVTQSTGAGAAAPWSMRLTDGTSFYDARTIRALTSGDVVTIANPTANPETGLAKDATLTARLPAALDADGGLKIHVQNTSLAVTGTFWQATQPVSGPLTDTQLRATAVPVSGPLTDTQLRATPVPVSGTVSTGGLTDTQLRATPVPVSGTVSTGLTQPLTDTQLRASAVPVDTELTTADLDTGAGTDTRAVVGLARAESGGATLVGSANPLPIVVPGSVAVTGTFFQATQPVSGTVTANAGTGPWPVTDNGGSLTVDAPVGTPLRVDPTGTTTQPVSGTVTANAGTGPFPVSDNAGSLTVDAPVGTPAFVRLSDGAAAISTLPVSLATNTPDVTDRAARVLGIAQMRGSAATPVSARTTGFQSNPVLDVRLVEDSAGNKIGQDVGAPLYTVPSPASASIFAFSSAELTITTTAGVQEFLTIFHASASTQNVYLLDLRWTPTGTPITAGRAVFETQHITAENATPGGTTLTMQPINRAYAAPANVTIRSKPTGAPTTTGVVLDRRPITNFPQAATQSTLPGADTITLWDSTVQGAFTMRAGNADGLRLTLNVLSVVTGAQTGFVSGTISAP